MHSLFTLLLSFTLAHSEGIVLSLAFSKGRLAGVDKDAEAHRTLAERMKVPLVQLDDRAGKADLMAQIARAVQGRDPVVLLYAGHGLAVKPPLTSDEIAERRKPISYPSIRDDDDVDAKPMRDHRCKDSKSTDFLFASQATMDCMKGCEKPCTEACLVEINQVSKTYEPTDMKCRGKCPRGPQRRECMHACDDVRDKATAGVFERQKDCRLRCEKDRVASACGRACADEHALSANALGDVFKGKHVLGLIDACESGALKNSRLRGQLLAAVESDQVAGGRREGGLATAEVVRQMGDAACDANTARDGRLTLPQMLAETAAVGNEGCMVSEDVAAGPGLPPVRTFDYSKTCAGPRPEPTSPSTSGVTR